jgi:TetR/AcrR family transcriptional regulator
MTVIPSTRTQTERADQTRARILDAAIRQFSENGLAGARTERIAEAAGVNKALLYYYFSSKEALYSAAIEAVAERVQATAMAVLEADASAGERFLVIVLNHFDRIYSNRGFSNLIQQEMVRLHRGEENALSLLAERLFGPLWLRVREVVEQGIREGELIRVDWMQMLYTGLGANIFYFLSAPLIGLALGFQPLERSTLEFRRKAAIEYLGQTIFIDRLHGAQAAARVLAAAPMPSSVGTEPGLPSSLRQLFPPEPGAKAGAGAQEPQAEDS